MSRRLSLKTAFASLFSVTGLAALILTAPVGARAEEIFEATIVIKDHKFEPASLKVPSGKPVTLTVNNLDDTAEEFDSHDLQVEKVIGGKQSAIVRLKPLDKGNYDFMGEYHEASAKGVVVAE